MKASAPAGARRSSRLPRPILMWATLGALFLALTVYVIGAWMLSADFKAMPPQGVLDSTASRFIFWNQVVFCALTVICVFAWVVLPKIRTGRFSFMGLLVLAAATTYWQDPMSNYYSYGIAYNSGFWNRGSWANFIPGYSYPGMEKFPEAPLWVGTTYVWFNVMFPALFAWIWKKIDERFPRLGFGAVILSLMVVMFVIDIAQEVLYLRMGLYSYVGADQAWSVFGGHYYQFPIFIGVVTTFFFMGVTWIIHFRDDTGLSFVERGADKLRLSPGMNTLVRFLAIVAYMNVLTLGTYFIPVQWHYTHGDAIPADTPTYLTNNLCGEQAGFPCPGRGVPLPRRGGDLRWVNFPPAK